MRSLDQLRELLGLSAGDSLVEDSRVLAPATGVGHGLGTATVEAGLSAKTIEAILLQPNFTPDPELGRKLGIDSVARWAHDSRLIVLGDAAVSARAGAAELVPELGWLVDTRSDNTAIVVEGSGPRAAKYLAAENGSIALGHVEYGDQPSPPFVFRDPPRLELPDLTHLLEGLGVKRWLRDEVGQRAAAESVLVRAAAVGLAGRLAMGELEDPDRLFTAIVDGGADPLDMLRAWSCDLPADSIRYLEASALDEAGAIGDQIEELERLVSKDETEAARSALSSRRRRDDLESVVFVLRQATAEAVVLDALKALDRRAIAHLTTFDLITEPDAEPPLFGAVSAAQPEAWWGTVWSD
jgi:hypothetical protein